MSSVRNPIESHGSPHTDLCNYYYHTCETNKASPKLQKCVSFLKHNNHRTSKKLGGGRKMLPRLINNIKTSTLANETRNIFFGESFGGWFTIRENLPALLAKPKFLNPPRKTPKSKTHLHLTNKQKPQCWFS